MEWKDIMNYGLPTLFLGAVAWGAVRVARYTAAKVIDPLVGAGVEFFRELVKSLKEVREACNRLERQMDALHSRRRTHSSNNDPPPGGGT